MSKYRSTYIPPQSSFERSVASVQARIDLRAIKERQSLGVWLVVVGLIVIAATVWL